MNHLAHSVSPYLLQHASNPVDWHPWQGESLEKARRENKLILVSVGYSSCHWCHVMEHESFSQQNIAEVQNAHYVSIKVDREERPDVDAYLMGICRILTHGGGWPLNCLLLPDGRPFHAVTYLPAESWVELLQRAQTLWARDPHALSRQADSLLQALRGTIQAPALSNPVGKLPASPASGTSSASHWNRTWENLLDSEFGGFRGAPRFPMPASLQAFTHLQELQSTEGLRLLEAAVRGMVLGGIHDLVGGGFARYSVDGKWFAPHFEKMLYDNAQILQWLARLHRIVPSPLNEWAAKRLVGWMQREMLLEGQGLASALDADSSGEEGAYYVWKEDEIHKILGKTSEVESFLAAWSVRPQGNWESGENIFYASEDMRRQSSEDICVRLETWEPLLQKLLEFRALRPVPLRDHKIVTAWNALAVRALLEASEAFEQPSWQDLALQLLNWADPCPTGAQSPLPPRTRCLGAPGALATAEDLAALCLAHLEGWMRTGQTPHLQRSTFLLETLLWDYTVADSPFVGLEPRATQELPLPIVECEDSVCPSTNAMMALACLRLGHIWQRPELGAHADQLLAAMDARLQQQAAWHGLWVECWLERQLGGWSAVCIGPEASEFCRELRRKAPSGTLVVASPSPDAEIPLLALLAPPEKRTEIHLCGHGRCLPPLASPSEALASIARESALIFGEDKTA